MTPQEISAPGNGTQSHTFACIRCWKLKKKCDRVPSKCSRCHSLNVTCVYSSQPPTERPEALRSRASNPIRGHAQQDLHRNVQNLSALDTTQSIVVASGPGLASTEDELLPVVSIRKLFDDFLTAQLQDAFKALEPELRKTFHLYLETMNASIPFLIESQVKNLLKESAQIQDVDVRVLLLSVYLVTKLPTPQPEGGTDLYALYSVLKPFHINLTSKRRPTVHIIQAGMLIALYEHGQADFETAYLTIGVCARMGHAIGLHTSLRHSLLSDLGSRDTIETHKHVWWSLIILERLLALESLEPNRPFAIQHPTLEDLLPSFCGRDVEKFLTVGQMSAPSKHVSGIIFNPANSYARSCQATYLLSLVFEHIRDGTKDSIARHAEAVLLDKLLQEFSLSIISQANRELEVPWEYSCASWMICMFALCALHRCNLSLDSHISNENPTQTDFAKASRLALHSLSRVAIDGAEAKLDHYVEGARHSHPFVLHSFREMAVLILQMGHEEGKEIGELIKEISSLKTYIAVASEKWKLGGKQYVPMTETSTDDTSTERCLDAIDKVILELEQSQ